MSAVPRPEEEVPWPEDELLPPAARRAEARPRRPLASAGVVVGVDGSAGSAAALRWAAAEACRRQAVLRIVSAWQEADAGPALRACDAVPSLVAATRVQDALDSLLHHHARPRHVGCVTPRGEPGEMLVREAAGAGLLVLGMRIGADPGRTARHCLRYAGGPLVFVPA